MALRLRHHANGSALLAHAEAFLGARHADHRTLIGIANSPLAAPGDDHLEPYLVTVDEDASVIAAAVRTPPHALVLSWIAPEMRDLVLARLLDDPLAAASALSGIFGPIGIADLFAERCARATRRSARVRMQMRHFDLTRVIPPRPTAGAMRAATMADLDRIVAWQHAFIDETGLPPQEHQFVTTDAVSRRIEECERYLWSVDGVDVAMAGSGRTKATISLVYALPEHRRRGFASSLVAQLSHQLLDAGASVISLSTDLANPTSNGIYASIGYVPVADSLLMAIE